MMTEKRPFPLVSVVWGTGMLILGAFLGSYIHDSGQLTARGEGFEVRMGQQTFTNPLLECEVAADSISARKIDFSTELSSFTDILKQKNNISDIAVYFRDLNNGPISGVNQNIPFAPASLLKVPIMMTYFSRSESDPGLLERKITFANDNARLLPDTQDIPPEYHIELGKTYTIGELIEYMIKYSDNQAMALLYEQIPVADQVELYTRIGVDATTISDPSTTLSVKQYSIFFRILFNASYLSRTDSERALALLSQSTFNDGLRAGVPSSIPVAHKFGERQFSDQLQQFHDCGIIYYPKHPYLLCVMTRGRTLTTLTHVIADVSRFVYEKIDAQYGARI